MFTGGKLWWADEESAQLGTVTKRDGRNLVILRNKTNGVVHMKVYDREGQKGKLSHVQMQNNLIKAKKDILHPPVHMVNVSLVVHNIQEETRARSTMEAAHSCVSPPLRTPAAAPALSATTCVVTACHVRVSSANTHCTAANVSITILYSMTLTKTYIFVINLYTGQRASLMYHAIIHVLRV